MVKEYGMSDRLGYVTFEKEQKPLFLASSLVGGRDYSEDTAQQIDAEVKKIIDETYERVKELLTSKKEKLADLAHLLLEKEVVEMEELKKLLQLEPASA
jgi:cell division protease FtsH